MNDEGEMSDEVGRQLLASPWVLLATGGIMLILGLVPGMPALAFIGFGLPLVYVAWRLQQRVDKGDLAEAELLTESIAQTPSALRWEDIPHVDRISIELGFRPMGQLSYSDDRGVSDRVFVLF